MERCGLRRMCRRPASPITIAECVRELTVNAPVCSWGSRAHKKGRCGSPRVCQSITNHLHGWSAASAPTVAAHLESVPHRDTVLWSVPSITLKNGRQTKLTRASKVKFLGMSSMMIFHGGERWGHLHPRGLDRRGENENPTEKNNVNHAEAVEITFDPDRLSYRELLEYFFMVHRADLGEHIVGTGYRSEIFHTSEEQRVVAEETIRDASGYWLGKVVTRVSKAGRLWEEASEQQNYFQRFPVGCPAPPFPRQGEPAATS